MPSATFDGNDYVTKNYVRKNIARDRDNGYNFFVYYMAVPTGVYFLGLFYKAAAVSSKKEQLMSRGDDESLLIWASGIYFTNSAGTVITISSLG